MASLTRAQQHEISIAALSPISNTLTADNRGNAARLQLSRESIERRTGESDGRSNLTLVSATRHGTR